MAFILGQFYTFSAALRRTVMMTIVRGHMRRWTMVHLYAHKLLAFLYKMKGII